MTGAPMPPGADTVVPVEDVEEAEATVRVPATPVGANVRAAAHDTRAGDEIELPGPLTAPKVAVLASIGLGEVLVRRRPRVAILSTGDELVGVGEALGPHQIHDSNGVALAAAVIEAGGEPIVLPRARDDAGIIERTLLDGGVSRRPARHLGRRLGRPARPRAERPRRARHPRLLAHRDPARQAPRGRGAGRRHRRRIAGQPGERPGGVRAHRATAHPRHARAQGRRSGSRGGRGG